MPAPLAYVAVLSADPIVIVRVGLPVITTVSENATAMVTTSPVSRTLPLIPVALEMLTLDTVGAVLSIIKLSSCACNAFNSVATVDATPDPFVMLPTRVSNASIASLTVSRFA